MKYINIITIPQNQWKQLSLHLHVILFTGIIMISTMTRYKRWFTCSPLYTTYSANVSPPILGRPITEWCPGGECAIFMALNCRNDLPSVTRHNTSCLKYEKNKPLETLHYRLACWSLTSLCHSNEHIETMPAGKLNSLPPRPGFDSSFLFHYRYGTNQFQHNVQIQVSLIWKNTTYIQKLF